MKIAVKRNAQGDVIGVMKGDFTLVSGYVLEDDTGQKPPIPVVGPTKLRLKNVVSGAIVEFEVLSQ